MLHRIFISLYTVSFRSNKVKCRKEEKQPKRYEEVIVDIECFLNENETGDFDFDLNDEFIVDNEESSLNNVLFDDGGEEGNGSKVEEEDLAVQYEPLQRPARKLLTRKYNVISNNAAVDKDNF